MGNNTTLIHLIQQQQNVSLNPDGSFKSPFHDNIYIIAFQIALCTVGIPLDGLSAIAVVRLEELRQKPRHVFFVAIQLCNLLAYFVSLLEIIVYFNIRTNSPSYEPVCRVYLATAGLPQLFLPATIFLSIVDRYLAISRPLWHRSKVTARLVTIGLMIFFILIVLVNKFVFIAQLTPMTCQIHLIERKIIGWSLWTLFGLCLVGRIVVYTQSRRLIATQQISQAAVTDRQPPIDHQLPIGHSPIAKADHRHQTSTDQNHQPSINQNQPSIDHQHRSSTDQNHQPSVDHQNQPSINHQHRSSTDQNQQPSIDHQYKPSTNQNQASIDHQNQPSVDQNIPSTNQIQQPSVNHNKPSNHRIQTLSTDQPPPPNNKKPNMVTILMNRPTARIISAERTKRMELEAMRSLASGLTALILLNCPLMIFSMSMSICRTWFSVPSNPKFCYKFTWLVDYFKQLSNLHGVYHPVMCYFWDSEILEAMKYIGSSTSSYRNR